VHNAHCGGNMSSPVPVRGAGNPLGHRMAASRLLLDDTPALAEQRRALLPPAMDDRNAALVELNLTTAAGAAEVAQRFLERFASVFGDGPAGGPPPPQQTSGYFRCWLTPPESKELLTADGRAGQTSPRSRAHIVTSSIPRSYGSDLCGRPGLNWQHVCTH
jgi:hypothetical protein